MPPYSLQDVAASYRWLGHQGFTELNAFHRDYQPGRQNAGFNERHNLFPIIMYARKESDVVRFVQRNHPYRMLCYGLNPRPGIFQNSRGKPRSAREDEIEVVQNLVLDIDAIGKQPSNPQMTALADLLRRADAYFLDLRLQAPVKAYTGRGYHLLFAFPEIQAGEFPDIGARLKHFAKEFSDSYKHELAALDARLDGTQDLRRMVKIYGTAKPLIGIISRFYGGKRLEDEQLRERLLGLQLPHQQTGERNFTLRPATDLPQWFVALLETDSRTREIWSGIGKPESTDTSRSGYDYSLVLRLLHLGHRNLDELAAILSLRPEGSVQQSGKDESYVRRTISKAIR